MPVVDINDTGMAANQAMGSRVHKRTHVQAPVLGDTRTLSGRAVTAAMAVAAKSMAGEVGIEEAVWGGGGWVWL